MIFTHLTLVTLKELSYCTCVQVRVAAGQTVLILASQHLQTVITTLVNQPLPYDRYIYKMYIKCSTFSMASKSFIKQRICFF